MSVAALRPLKQALLDEYGSFNIKTIKKLDTGKLFIVDDRGKSDFDARKQLYSWFCHIFVEVLAADSVRVMMGGGVPDGSKVAAWAKKWTPDYAGGGLSFLVGPTDVAKLTELADAIAVITKGTYPVKAYKYVVPRTAQSLRRLHKVLAAHWAE